MTTNRLSRRNFLRASTLATVGAVMAACAPAPAAKPEEASPAEGNEAASGAVKLRLLTWEGGEGLQLLKDIVSQFSSENPNIQIEVSTPAGDYYTVLQTQVAAGDPPDLIQIGEAYLPPWAEKGTLLPLDDYLSSDPDGKLDDFYKPIIKVFQHKGKTYVLPKDFVTWALFYNKSLFDKAGLAYPDENWTEDQYREAAQKLTITDDSGNVTQYGQLVDTGWGNYFPMMWQHGGQYLNADLNKCLLDSPETIEAWQLWADMISKDKSAPTPVVATQAGLGFETGKVAMQIMGSYMVPGFQKITEFEWDIAHKPVGPKGRSSILYGSGFGISSKSKSPDQAWQFVKFMTYLGSEKLAAQGFSIPSRKSVATKPGVYIGAEKTKGKNVQVFVDAVEYARLQELTGTWTQEEQLIRAELDLVWLGQKSASDAIKAIVPQIDDLLASS